MRPHIHIAVPGEEGPQVPAHRDAVQMGVGDGHRLDGHRPPADADRCRAEQGAAEGQHEIAVAARALGEQDQVVAGGKPFLEHLGLAGGEARVAVDEDGAADFGAEAEQRPAGDFRLGDETPFEQRAEHRNIRVGGVVHDIEHRPLLHRPAGDLQPDAEQAVEHAVDGDRPFAGEVQPQREVDRLDRDQHGEPDHAGEQADRRPDVGDVEHPAAAPQPSGPDPSGARFSGPRLSETSIPRV